MTPKLQQKVIDLRNSVTVEGKPLVAKKWSDEQVASQIELLLNQKVFSSDKLDKQLEVKLKLIPQNLSIDESVEWIKKEMYTLVNWVDYTYIPDFWKEFSSAPYTMKFNNNPILTKAMESGAKGMDEIFDNKFEKGFSMTYQLNNLLYYVKNRIEEDIEMKKIKSTIYSSPYKNVEEIIDSLPEKKAKEAGRVFYLDKTKPMEARIKAFDKYGDKPRSIHQPSHPSLMRIFDIFNENSYYQRHEMVNCLSVIEWWMENVQVGKTVIDYSQNQYHPSLKKKKRKYAPSKAGMKRLENAYIEILFVEGVSEFELDW